MNVTFLLCILNVHWNGIFTELFDCCIADSTRNCCHLGACFMYTIQPCSSLQCHFIWSNIRRVHVWLVSLAETCHKYFWQNDWDFVCASVVTWVWNEHWNKRQHTKLTLENIILLPLLLRLSITSLAIYHWAIPAPFARLVTRVYLLINLVPYHQGKQACSWVLWQEKHAGLIIKCSPRFTKN